MFAIRQILHFAILLDHRARLAEIVAWHAGKEVVCNLQMQTAVNKLDVGRTYHIHGCTQLTGGERLAGTKVLGRTCKVRQDNLPISAGYSMAIFRMQLTCTCTGDAATWLTRMYANLICQVGKLRSIVPKYVQNSATPSISHAHIALRFGLEPSRYW